MVVGMDERTEKEQGNLLPRRSQRLSALIQTTMLPSLPPELLDLVVHHLRDEPTTLKACCLISRLWFYLTQRHLFACVEFHARNPTSNCGRRGFRILPPLPLTTRAVSPFVAFRPSPPRIRMRVAGSTPFTTSSICTWSTMGWEDDQVSLVPFHGLSPTLKSLRLTSAFSEVLDLICSFPLLEDLALVSLGPGSDSWSTPSTSPKLTGSLALRTFGGSGLSHVDCWTSRMVSTLPRSRWSVTSKMSSRQWVWCRGVLTPSNLSAFIVTPWVRFLQLLRVVNDLQLLVDVDTSGTPPLDLSKATKLKELSFRFGGLDVQRITMALQTVQSKHLQQITIHSCGNFANPVEETVRQGWQDLDRTCWSNSGPPTRFVQRSRTRRGRDRMIGEFLASRLLPELTRRGLVDLVASQCRYMAEE
jgi:hypothetical protein